MKKISNTIRIGLVRRGATSPKLSEEPLSPNTREQIHHQPVKEQNGHGMPSNDQFRDQQHISTFTSPNSVRLHDVSDTNVNKQKQPQINDLPEYRSSSPMRSQQETVNKLHQIPIKAKWSTAKKVLVGASTAAVLGALTVVAVALGVVLSAQGQTTATTTTSTSTVPSTAVTASWSFDNVATDLYGVYNGSLINGATYTAVSSSNVPYFGNGQALALNSALNQAFSVPSSPILGLNMTSFTIEAWIYSGSVFGDHGIFGQCQCSTCANQCLYFICRSNHLYIGFTLNDLLGSTNLLVGTWYHVAFVYNYQTQQQILYVNGIQDAIKSNAAPYQGRNGSIQIGSTQVFGSPNFFLGYIDNVLVTTRAKSSDEILRDASLMFYFSFDLPNPNADSSLNKFTGIAASTVTLSGRVNQAIRLIGNGSYFQIYGLSQVPAGVPNSRTFSISMWINPSAGGSSTFVQLFPSTATQCVNLLGIYSLVAGSTGQIVVQSSNGGQAAITGPYVTLNVWTHISLTYSTGNGYILYYNGSYAGSTGAYTYTATSGTFTTLYLGYSTTSCAWGGQNFAYQGSIDEVYVHNRELTQAEVTVLANP